MAELMEDVRVLADKIGPRPVSTEEEHQAALYIAQELSEDGLEVDVDEFATSTGTRWPYAIAFMCIVAGALVSGVGIFVESIATSMLVVGILLIAFGLVVYYMEHNGKPILSKRRVNGVSQNVVARYVPSSVAREQRRRKIVITSHVDTVRAQPENIPALARHASILRKIAYFDAPVILAIAVVRLLPLPWPAPEAVDLGLWIASLVCSAYLLVAAICIMVYRVMPYLAGGNDNASSNAVLLATASRLLNPEERERYAVERPVEQDSEHPVETFMTPHATGSFKPASGTGEFPFIHGEEAAREAGAVPEGATLEYAEDARAPQEPAPAPVPEPAPAPEPEKPLSAWEQRLRQAVAAEAGAEPEPVAQAAPAAPVQPAPQPAAQQPAASAKPAPAAPRQSYAGVPSWYKTAKRKAAEDEAGKKQEEPDEKRSYRSRFADVPLSVTRHEEPAPAPEPEPAPEPAPAEGASVQMSGVFEPVAQPAASPAQSTVPASATTVVMQPATVQLQSVSQSVSSGAVTSVSAVSGASAPASFPASAVSTSAASTAPAQQPAVAQQAPAAPAQQPAAAQQAPASQQPATSPAPQPAPVQQAPAAPALAQQPASAQPAPAAQQPAPVPAAPRSEPVQPAPAAPAQPVSAPATSQPAAPASAHRRPTVAPSSKAVSPAANAEMSAEISELLDFSLDEDEGGKSASSAIDISDEELDDISPDDVSDAIAGSEGQSKQAGGKGDRLRGIASHIPAVSGPNSSQRFEPVSVDEAPAKPARRKPTVRHVSEDFQPTQVIDPKQSGVLAGLRQEAPVSSTYEDTEQADPFAPRDMYGNVMEAEAAKAPKAARAPRASSAPVSPASPARRASPGASASFEPISPSATSSFPSLTGSFPALTGSMPTVNMADFGAKEEVYDQDLDTISDDVADDFVDEFGMAAEIQMPESRFHNAVDKVSGIFKRDKGEKKAAKPKKQRKSRRSKKADERGWEETGDVESWNEDDDFGWKGGGYLDPEESAFEAAKERASEIRESVVSMTESDLLDKEVWFVALGASSANNRGMENFLELHGSDLRGALVINLECVGAGEVKYLDYEGRGKAHHSDRRLQSLVRGASREIDGLDMQAANMMWRDTDATPAMEQGMRAITLAGLDGDAPVNWHWKGDTSELVDEDNLEYVTKLLLKIIEEA